MAKDKMILLDTNIFIHYFNGEQKAKKAFDSIGAEHIALSIITFAEII
jgi:predicted nucleic acid-binding protein